jgi:hypothetical protein
MDHVTVAERLNQEDSAGTEFCLPHIKLCSHPTQSFEALKMFCCTADMPVPRPSQSPNVYTNTTGHETKATQFVARGNGEVKLQTLSVVSVLSLSLSD